MNSRSLFRPAVIACLVVGVLFGLAPARAQGNLLTNPGFEDPYQPQGGEPVRQVAQGWTAWHLPAVAGSPTYMNQQPEYLPTRPDTTRIRGGTNAQFVTSFFATFDGGVLQEVTGLTPGAQLDFSAWVYVWSSAFDDPDESQLDGSVVVQVGLDPNGGTDPTSADIVWSQARQVYDEYTQHRVQAAALADRATVFVRAIVGAPAKNNNVYIDDASLTVVGGAQPATATTVPPTATTVPPSATPVPPTATTVPPSATAVPPTATTVAPSLTPVPPTAAPAASTTPVPPTPEVIQATATTVPATATTVPPTNTTVPPSSTPVPPTNTPAGPTMTPTVTLTPTLRPTLDTSVYRSTISITVQFGDSLDRLARTWGSTIDAIMTANNFGPDYMLHPGDRIIVPVRLAPLPTLPAAPTLVPPTSAPPATVPPVPTTGIIPTATPVSAPVTFVTYVVVPGDTLWAIAARYGTTIQAIAQANGIANPNRILAGQTLRIPLPAQAQVPTAVPQAPPAPTVPPALPVMYTVRPGDTLFRISAAQDVSVGALIQLNAITNPNLIFVGQVLRLR